MSYGGDFILYGLGPRLLGVVHEGHFDCVECCLTLFVRLVVSFMTLFLRKNVYLVFVLGSKP